MKSSRNHNTNAGAGGLGLSGVLAVVFIVLKLVGVINWSWWWVLSPIWISWGIAIVFIVIFAIIVGILNR